MREGYDHLKKAHIRLQADIYSLAYAAFIDPDQLNGEPGYFQQIPMSNDEVTNIYLGAIMVIFIQLTVICLITNHMQSSPGFTVAPANSYTIILARFNFRQIIFSRQIIFPQQNIFSPDSAHTT